MKRRTMIIGVLGALVLSITTSAPAEAAVKTVVMRASWYSAGHTTANGDAFNPNIASTAAHKTCPFGTELTLTNPKNGRALVVKVNDRGPFIKGRALDLTKAGAKALGFLNEGVTELHVVGAERC